MWWSNVPILTMYPQFILYSRKFSRGANFLIKIFCAYYKLGVWLNTNCAAVAVKNAKNENCENLKPPKKLDFHKKSDFSASVDW